MHQNAQEYTISRRKNFQKFSGLTPPKTPLLLTAKWFTKWHQVYGWTPQRNSWLRRWPHVGPGLYWDGWSFAGSSCVRAILCLTEPAQARIRPSTKNIRF